MVFLISENETNYKFGISIKNTIKCHTLKHVFCSISLIFFLSFSIAVSMKFCAVMLLLKEVYCAKFDSSRSPYDQVR